MDNSVHREYCDDKQKFRAIAIALSLYLAYQFVVYGLRSVLERDYNLSVEEGIKAQIQENLHKKAMRVDIALFDDEDFYNDYSQALSDLDEKTIESFKQSVKVLEAIISTLTLAGTIAVLSPTLIFFRSGFLGRGCLGVKSVA